MKITFKREAKARGLAGVGYPHPNVIVKVDGRQCGIIHAPTWNDIGEVWTVTLFVVKKNILEDGNENCPWRSYTFSKRCLTEDEAREFVLRVTDVNTSDFLKSFTLHLFEKEI